MELRTGPVGEGLDQSESNRAQRLNASRYKAPAELPSITI